ncbi:MAG: nuclear transport factor 2 family protein [Armatimonadetes bacterium]|nr:nuclear transport factor 2 family protein [Armatimonadota bacterium]
MKRLVVPIFLFAAMCNATASVPAAWRARYDRLERVFSSKDMPALDALCGKDLVWIQIDGTQKNRQETLNEFAEMFKSDRVKVHEKLRTVKRRGQLVDVFCEVFMVWSVPGKSDGRMHSYCTDTWSKIDGKWQLVKTVDTMLEMTGGD